MFINFSKMIKRTCILLLFFGGLFSCDLEQEISVDIPGVESQVVVECYLEPGEPYELLLTRSSGYFDPFPSAGGEFLDGLLVDSAVVQITDGKDTVELENRLLLNPRTRKISNYNTSLEVPLDFDAEYELFITLPKGTTITAKTRMLEPIVLDSIVVEFEEQDTMARVLTYFTDNPDQDNFYRRMLHEVSLDSIPLQDFTTDDRIVEDVVVYGSGFVFEVGDTVINTIFHITSDYYNFLESVQRAESSNNNPFAQPSPIISNLEGTANAIGIFTGLSYSRDMRIIEF